MKKHVVELIAAVSVVAVFAQAQSADNTPEPNALSCVVSGDGTHADFTFAPGAEARTLLVGYGPKDCKSDLSGWEFTEEIAAVPANTGSLSGIALPGTFDVENHCLRAYLLAACDAGSYAKPEHLIAQWDGIENDGFGVHSESAAYPIDLRGNLIPDVIGGSIAVNADSFVLGGGYMKFNAADIIGAINAGAATVELVLGHTGSVRSNGGVFCAGGGTRALWAYQDTKNTIGSATYHGRISGDFVVYERSADSAGSVQTYSFALGENSAASYLMLDGVKLNRTESWTGGSRDAAGVPAQLTRHSTDCEDNELYIGLLPGTWNIKPIVNVHSIRVYDCVLTEQEIARNTAIDGARFRGDIMVDVMSEACGTNRPLHVGKVTRSEQRPVSAELSFPIAYCPRELHIVYDRADRGTSADDWADIEFVTNIAPDCVSCTVEIPASVVESADGHGGFRFVLRNAVGTLDYVRQDHLIAQWDGVENKDFGIHDSNVSYPVELRQKRSAALVGNAFPIHDNSFDFGSGSIRFSAPDVIQAINEGHATLEIVTEKNGSYLHNGGFFGIGPNKTRCFWLYQQSAAFANACSYHGVSSHYDNIGFNDDGITTLSFPCGTGASMNWYANGIARTPVFRNGNSDCQTSEYCYIGSLGNGDNLENYRAHARVYSVRIYDVELTAEEIVANKGIDDVRFRGVFGGYECSQYTPFIPCGMTIIVK